MTFGRYVRTILGLIFGLAALVTVYMLHIIGHSLVISRDELWLCGMLLTACILMIDPEVVVTLVKNTPKVLPRVIKERVLRKKV